MPHPSSTTVDEEVRMEDSQKGLLGVREEIHSANRGVIFHRTGLRSRVRKNYT